ncbi:type 1 glutamine amidotransferase [Desulfurobacterium atlanticum]|uniref:GMP synthase - Glutamine amidotransferase n=1 Tax=Desulfurobacterium atlanticum TaxID=240169 RepID=A0A238ZR56_9BACT|nr:GMP synthase [Desulfurobacterium atlanticum]SNR85887.1 GMP synthase - Glutamine amidotransferase [Desulfurobacterium atlanticum]
MKALFVKNIEIEGPGTLAPLFERKGLKVETISAFKNETVDSIDDYEVITILGGPMGVYEAEKYPFLKYEFKLVEEAIKKGKRVVGICLGSQIIAHVLGARVYKGEMGKEIGWYELYPQNEFEYIFQNKIEVFQWHGDTFDIPEGAVKLASTPLYPNQAFRYEKAVGIQFHIEVTKEDILKWIEAYKDEVEKENLTPEQILGNNDKRWDMLKVYSSVFVEFLFKI